AILEEQQEEWLVAQRYFSHDSMAKLYSNLAGTEEQTTALRTLIGVAAS
ncbi:MAG: IS256 family transposase, partial [Bacillota bacterium]